MKWSEFEQAAPELAARGRESIERFNFVLIGTVRSDGAPRINPVEAYVVNGQLTMNMMWRSRKALDLLRDSRILVHSVITRREGDEGDEGEFKLRGRASSRRDFVLLLLELSPSHTPDPQLLSSRSRARAERHGPMSHLALAVVAA